MGFKSRHEEFPLYMEMIAAQAARNKINWMLDGQPVSMDQSSAIAKRLFAHLVMVARGEASDTDKFALNQSPASAPDSSLPARPKSFGASDGKMELLKPEWLLRRIQNRNSARCSHSHRWCSRCRNLHWSHRNRSCSKCHNNRTCSSRIRNRSRSNGNHNNSRSSNRSSNCYKVNNLDSSRVIRKVNNSGNLVSPRKSKSDWTAAIFRQSAAATRSSAGISSSDYKLCQCAISCSWSDAKCRTR